MTDVWLLTMMKSRPLRALLCAAVLAVGMPLADAQSRRTPSMADYIVAVVNQELVTNAELQSRLARIREEAARTKQQLPPPAELRNALRAMKVVMDVMQTGPAIRTYNVMIGERRRVAAALIAVP